MDFAAAFAELFPISSDTFSLELVRETVNEETGEISGGVHEHRGAWRATLRTITWDIEGDQRSIRDVKEQDVFLGFADTFDDPRLPAYLEGWAAALRFIFTRHAELSAEGALPERLHEAFNESLPSDFICADLLALRRPQSADDFMEALLSSKKRLGRFIA